MPASRHPNITVIGAGKVGSALASALAEKGYRFVSVISRTGPSALALARKLKCLRASTQIADVAPSTELVLIATPDSAVQAVARELSKAKGLPFRKLFVLHTSGVHGAGILEPLRKKGALTGSLHPVQSFPDARTPAQHRSGLSGIYYGLDGNSAALERLETIVRHLNGRSLVVPGPMRPLYHLACVFSSGGLVVLLNVISELAAELALKASWTEVFGPLLASSMEQSVKRGPAQALTGPVVRNDTGTIALHLEALSKHAPQFLPLYTVSAVEAGRIAQKTGTISREDARELLAMFRAFVRRQSPKSGSGRSH